ncbi:glycosyltransferase [Algibacter pectinivorans]|uniref:Glycosyltransferase involved in cell wall bisynthesis n=1 Tax=Algibacter pectinivorans TaxID=870482 RepID=A0A1I1PDN9_9FLAO|nr:glycosyltransferase [Algibacter pectinivorans]SFD07816.1 Glycosyltransferase involved in cell wall bisynthesis [Algibacter pectinivorans]
MKRILLILPYGGVGGMERLAYSFYNFYKKQGYFIKAVKFIKLESDIINFDEDELFLSKLDYQDMTKANRLLFNLKAPLKLRALIKKHKITHSIAFGDPPNLYSSLTFTNEYKIGSIHALKSVELSNNSKLSKLTRFGFKYTYKKLDKLVCISKAIKEDLIKQCDYKFEENLKVIYNPHDIEEINKKALEPLNAKEQDTLFKTKTLLFLGRLSTQKSPWHLIKAFSLLLKESPETQLLIIGDGDASVTNHVKSLIETFKIDKNVVFLGRKSNPYKYLAKADALVLSSHYEGTPNVIVEAICLGTPIVTSNCTEGILELMSLKAHNKTNKNLIVESGIITPNLFKGRLGIPKDNTFIQEETLFANALHDVLHTQTYRNTLQNHKNNLLDKFNLEHVANTYLNDKIN